MTRFLQRISAFVWPWVKNRKKWLASLEPKKSQVSVAYDRNSVSDLTGYNDAATNGVVCRIGNKTWCKCECCTPMETSMEGVCCLEIRKICNPIFSGTLSLHVCRSDPHFVPWYSLRENFVSYFIFTPNVDPWQIRIRFFYQLKLRNIVFCKTFHLLFFSLQNMFFVSVYLKRASNWIHEILYYWKAISYHQNHQRQPSTGAQEPFNWWKTLRDKFSWNLKKIFKNSIFFRTSEGLLLNISEKMSSAFMKFYVFHFAFFLIRDNILRRVFLFTGFVFKSSA